MDWDKLRSGNAQERKFDLLPGFWKPQLVELLKHPTAETLHEARIRTSER